MKSAKKLSVGFVTGFLTCFVLFGGTVAFAASGILAERSACRVFVDGREVQMEAYMIEGSNYLKLRDVGELVGFNVWWDGAVRIDSSSPYTGTAPAGKSEQPSITDAAPAPDASAEANAAVFSGSYTREGFNALRQVVTGAEKSGSVMMTEETRQAMQKAAAAISDWPGYQLNRTADGMSHFTASYSTSYEDAAKFCQAFIDGLAEKGDRDKVKEIAFYVCDRLTYDAGSTATPRVALSTMGVNKGNCMSYAHNFKFLCDMASIPCIFVHSADHQWNMVYVEGSWWHVDVSSIDVGDNIQTRAYSRVLYDDDYVQGASYRQTEPELTAFVKEVLVPGSTR